MPNIPETAIEQAVSAIVNARDLCGNEREAADQAARDAGFPAKQDRDKIWRIANFRANARWNAYKKAAGVNPKYTW